MRNLIKNLVLGFGLVFLGSCGDRVDDALVPPSRAPLQSSQRDQFCPPMKGMNGILEAQFLGQRKNGVHSFTQLKDSINSACATCHLAPSNTAGISYTDSYENRELTLGGVTKEYPGIFELAEKFHGALTHSDPKKLMPPESRRNKNPEAFVRMAKELDAWIQAGKPNGNFSLDAPGSQESPAADTSAMVLVNSTELGDCVPVASIVDHDYQKDRVFAKADKLPKDLIDTDLFSLDAFQLAQKGTVAYNVEFPLWADNAEKGRWVHVPLKRDGNRFVKDSIKYNEQKDRFDIPENTRFYKNFYKEIKLANGKKRFKRIETRLIVVRYPWDKSLFGTYRWDESEQSATLVETPYRDGTPFKDSIFSLTVDEKTGKQRQYMIPGSQRCIDCHRGSENGSFVLGMTPLQINRRAPGEYARNPKVTADEVSQADRLLSYGVIDGIQSANLPRIEALAGSSRPRNIYEVKAQGYMAGNCAHCHNPNGLALMPSAGIKFDMSPGKLYGFPTHTKSVEYPTRNLVNSSGDLDSSYLFSKINDTAEQQGFFSRMPMHTPALPDCESIKTIGKWIRSFESDQAAKDFNPSCKTPDEFPLVDADFTWPTGDGYIPRRNDWADPVGGMPQKFRDLSYTPDLEKLMTSKIAVGYWAEKDSCKFPDITIPKEDQRPWMLDSSGEPKYPFGQVYYTTPGSWFFRSTCMTCHGPNADGQSSLASGILNWSGGSVRVANFMADFGLFGKKGENLKTFDVKLPDGSSKNLAGNYLIWMAMEGTRVKFPPQASNFVGKHGGQMLFLIRDTCYRQISLDRRSKPRYEEHEVFNKVCFYNNLSPDDPGLQFDRETAQPLHPEVVEAWLDKAATNAGWAVFQYLKDAGQGNWQPGNDQCEKNFPR